MVLCFYCGVFFPFFWSLSADCNLCQVSLTQANSGEKSPQLLKALKSGSVKPISIKREGEGFVNDYFSMEKRKCFLFPPEEFFLSKEKKSSPPLLVNWFKETTFSFPEEELILSLLHL